MAVEPDTGIVTSATLTPDNAADGPTGVRLLGGEDGGREVYADSAYGGGDTRADNRRGGHDPVIKPIPLGPADPGRFTRDDFIIDHRARTATCPGGHTLAITAHDNAMFEGPPADWSPRIGGSHVSDGAEAGEDAALVHRRVQA